MFVWVEEEEKLHEAQPAHQGIWTTHGRIISTRHGKWEPPMERQKRTAKTGHAEQLYSA